jgi:hypothetical protein
MHLVRRVGGRSLIYTATSALQKGAMFLLLPLYTRYLTPGDYGIVAVVTAVNSLLGVFFTFSLHGAMTRFYFEYRDEPEKLKEFWGTQLTTVLLISVISTGALFLFGERLARHFLGGIPFWPFLALGLLIAFFQPTFTIFLALLQTKEQAARYSIFSLAQFAATLLLVMREPWLGRWQPLRFFLSCRCSLYAVRSDSVYVRSTCARALATLFPWFPTRWPRRYRSSPIAYCSTRCSVLLPRAYTTSVISSVRRWALLLTA